MIVKKKKGRETTSFGLLLLSQTLLTPHATHPDEKPQLLHFLPHCNLPGAPNSFLNSQMSHQDLSIAMHFS